MKLARLAAVAVALFAICFTVANHKAPPGAARSAAGRPAPPLIAQTAAAGPAAPPGPRADPSVQRYSFAPVTVVGALPRKAGSRH